MGAYRTIVHHLFQKENPAQVEAGELDELLTKYPYLAHLHWLNAFKNKNDKTLHKASLYAYYPRILQHFLSGTEEIEADAERPGEKNGPAGNKRPEKPLLQPLYTEDYFAYTRTKLPEKIENDKPPTMEQVRSFTGWLRMMKKPQPSLEPETESAEEAENPEQNDSLKKEQVITESMAEIWIRHGRPEEAIRIYDKLILLNPEKKGYFAAKISALKKQ